MKILLVSLASIHFFRWAKQLEKSGYEVHFFDVNDGAPLPQDLNWIIHHRGWRRRWDYPKRFWLKKRLPKIYKLTQKLNDRTVAEGFSEVIENVQPDVVHSFVMYWSTYPIFSTMQRYNSIKWIYSSWGSDLYYHQNLPESLDNMRVCLPAIDYLITDNKRDVKIAKSHGFKGAVLGVIPGGGGYNLEKLDQLKKPLKNRKIILIKGYQNRHGRCNVVLEAILLAADKLNKYDIVVYGAESEAIKHITKLGLNTWSNFKVFSQIPHKDLLSLMGKSCIHIGNSVSDGMPNSLLEAVLMGCFPIQSNPGGATEDVIKNGVNGLLIEDPLNHIEIAEKLNTVVSDDSLLEAAWAYNTSNIIPHLGFEVIKSKVLAMYDRVFDGNITTSVQKEYEFYLRESYDN